MIFHFYSNGNYYLTIFCSIWALNAKIFYKTFCILPCQFSYGGCDSSAGHKTYSSPCLLSLDSKEDGQWVTLTIQILLLFTFSCLSPAGNLIISVAKSWHDIKSGLLQETISGMTRGLYLLHQGWVQRSPPDLAQVRVMRGCRLGGCIEFDYFIWGALKSFVPPDASSPSYATWSGDPCRW